MLTPYGNRARILIVVQDWICLFILTPPIRLSSESLSLQEALDAEYNDSVEPDPKKKQHKDHHKQGNRQTNGDSI